MRIPVLILIPLLSLAACGGQSDRSDSSAVAGNLVGTPAPGSKFSRIHLGMGKNEVQSIIGPPTDENTHLTGKVAIPFYFGGGTTEIDAYYKSEGVLTYASHSFGSSAYDLITIKADPLERGFVR